MEETKGSAHDRLLKGVMRVGLLAKGLLLKDDNEVPSFSNSFEVLTFYC